LLVTCAIGHKGHTFPPLSNEHLWARLLNPRCTYALCRSIQERVLTNECIKLAILYVQSDIRAGLSYLDEAVISAGSMPVAASAATAAAAGGG
jgi:hypothetical protein